MAAALFLEGKYASQKRRETGGLKLPSQNAKAIGRHVFLAPVGGSSGQSDNVVACINGLSRNAKATTVLPRIELILRSLPRDTSLPSAVSSTAS